MHYLTGKINNLPDDERRRVTAELMSTATQTPETVTDKIKLSLMADYTNDAREYYENFGKFQGISSGYKNLDGLTKGLVPGELVVIAGKTSYGKTTLALNVANRVALTGERVLFVTLEMTKPELTSRFMFLNGGDTDAFYAVSALVALQSNDELDWKMIDPLIEHAREELNVGLVVIDHLHYFTRELQNVAEDLGRITKELKKNAARHKLPVILISHVRKTLGKEANIDDLRSSSYIAQDADIVLMVGREDNGDKMLVKIEKNRNRGFDYKNPVIELDFDRTKLTEKVVKVPHPWNELQTSLND